MNPLVILLLVSYLTISLVYGDGNPYNLLDASELRRKYLLEELVEINNKIKPYSYVFRIKEKNSESGEVKEFGLKYRCSDNIYNEYKAHDELNALRFVTDNNIPFANRLIATYHCPPYMRIADGTKDHFNQKIEEIFKNDEYRKGNTYLNEVVNGGRFPLEFLDYSLNNEEHAKPMCFVVEYVSNKIQTISNSLKNKRDEFMKLSYLKQLISRNTYENKYAESLYRWTLQILTAYHFIHKAGMYFHRYRIGNFLIDSNNNVVIDDFEKSHLLPLDENSSGTDEKNNLLQQNSESTYAFSILLAHCDEESDLKFFENKSTDTKLEKLNKISLKLCENNWKKWRVEERSNFLLTWIKEVEVGSLKEWLLKYFLPDNKDKYKSAEDILRIVFETNPTYSKYIYILCI
eukprot:GHVR01150564.1.p1 GENE.GHVR01150564.1~~GHVR01150564.1.p1  ORF type:complete len:404 (+),score=73.17 GHVR01150564.1:53-1264(+)